MNDIPPYGASAPQDIQSPNYISPAGLPEIESALLGILLREPDRFYELPDNLLPSHFSDEFFGEVFRCIVKMVSEGRRPDVHSLHAHFKPLTKFNTTPIVDIVDAAGMPSETSSYGLTIIDVHKRRSFYYDMVAALDRLRTGSIIEDPADEIMSDIIASAIALESEDVVDTERVENFTDSSLNEVWKAVERRDGGGLAGVTTGIPNVDRVSGGYLRRELTIGAGRPGMGKTAFMGVGALAQARAGHHVWIRSVEMSKEELTKRFLGVIANVPINDMMKGEIGALERAALQEAAEEFRQLPIWIDDAGPESIDAIYRKALRQHARDGMDVLWLDYIQMITTADPRFRYIELGRATKVLKGLAKRLNIPAIVMAQLSRKVDDRPNKRPNISDLRESGDLEQDAGVVLLLYRESFYEPEFEFRDQGAKEPDGVYDNAKLLAEDEWRAAKSKAQVIFGKNRHGPMTTAHVGFREQTAEFF